MMYFHYDWVCQYLDEAPALVEAARLLNETGLETEIDGAGLEIEHTVNRPDAMCHYGVARELAVKTGSALREPEIFSPDIPVLEDWRIESEDSDLCPQYMGLMVDGIEPTASPAWLQERLTAIGQTCHNFVVDLTNFLLWEFGHPSHAFDADKIEGQFIGIRFGKPGEELVTLDGRCHKAEGFLCITDRERPIAFAGVMGGENSEVGPRTRSLLLELARFDGYEVRQTGRGCQIESDARHRFERGVDPENMDRVIRRFLYLLFQQQPNARLVGLSDMNARPFRRVELVLRESRLRRLLGINLDHRLTTSLLTRMDCQPSAGDDGWRLRIPGYKGDVTREVDVIEEVLRFAGLDLLSSELPAFEGSDFVEKPTAALTRQLKILLKTLGLQEACTFSFLPEAWDRMFTPMGDPVCLRNPMSEAQSVMRRKILPTLVDAMRRNINRGNVGFGLFEIGHVFDSDSERDHLAIALVEDDQRNVWWEVPTPHPFFAMKGVVETIAGHLSWADLTFEPTQAPFLDPQTSRKVCVGSREVGAFGCLAESVRQSMDVEAQLVVLELDLSAFPPLQPRSKTIQEPPSFPGIQIDMAFVVDVDVSYAAMRQHLDACRLDHLEDLHLFDVYQGKSLEKGKKSLGFRFHFRAAERTLTNEEVANTMDEVVESVQRKFGAVIRT